MTRKKFSGYEYASCCSFFLSKIESILGVNRTRSVLNTMRAFSELPSRVHAKPRDTKWHLAYQVRLVDFVLLTEKRKRRESLFVFCEPWRFVFFQSIRLTNRNFSSLYRNEIRKLWFAVVCVLFFLADNCEFFVLTECLCHCFIFLPYLNNSGQIFLRPQRIILKSFCHYHYSLAGTSPSTQEKVQIKWWPGPWEILYLNRAACSS